MNARYYLPGVGRFANADILVPEPFNPQSLNRFSYVNNNPINLIDPSGHCGYDQDEKLDKQCNNLAAQLEKEYGVDIVWDDNNQWSFHDLEILQLALKDTLDAMGSKLFKENFSSVKFINRRGTNVGGNGMPVPINVMAETCVEECFEEYQGAILFYFAWFLGENDDMKRWTTIHELGHVYDMNHDFELGKRLREKLTYKDCWWGCDATNHTLSGYDAGAHANGMLYADSETFAQAFAVAVFRGDHSNLSAEMKPYTSWGRWAKPVRIGRDYVRSTFK